MTHALMKVLQPGCLTPFDSLFEDCFTFVFYSAYSVLASLVVGYHSKFILDYRTLNVLNALYCIR